MAKLTDENRLSLRRPDLLLEWNYEANGDLKPENFTIGSNKDINWKCKFGHKWTAKINNRTHGRNCPVCAGRKVCFENCLATLNPNLALEWDYENSFPLTPFDVTCNSHKYAYWKCPFGHMWTACIKNRNNGASCPCCSGHKVCLDNCLVTLRPDLAKEWHPILNGTLTPCDVSCNSHIKAWWICEKGHVWDAIISDRNNKNNCPFCSGHRVCNDNCLATLRPDLAQEWSKNNKLTPFEVTVNSNIKVEWECDKGHIWEATINNRANGNGCPSCSESKGEKQTALILDNLNIKYKRGWRESNCRNILCLPFDFAILNEKEVFLGLIEYQGIQHYKPIERFGGQKAFESLQKRDLIKFNYCKNNKIPLLRIPYWEFDKIETLIKEFLNNEKEIKC